MSITNPILPGFFPDPSILRVGEDYFIANSSFEWFPGVPIHHSRDLASWTHIGHALTTRRQIDLRGVAPSGGVWAPSLSYADGKFWLIYTNVRTCGRGVPFKDLSIFLTTATHILGPWSDPVPLNAVGFDPSLFHDDDGRKWLVNMAWDHRKGRHRFAGIVAQELDATSLALVGEQRTLLEKPGVLIEGPNLYKQYGWYYLMLAEGGTGWNHGISMARARHILGPYELDPQPAVLTSRDEESQPLQKSGHGELVQTPAGEWLLVHLASRPIVSSGERRCMLGRETCLQRVTWSDDGWLRLAQGGHHPAVEISSPHTSSTTLLPYQNDFDDAVLDVGWSSLRVPMEPDWMSLTARPGWLRLVGRDSIHSLFDQSLIARRLPSTQLLATTCLQFKPTRFTQSAGLILYYDTRQHFYLRVTHDEVLGKVLGIVATDDGAYDELLDSQLAIPDWHDIYLRCELNGAVAQFSASPDGIRWQPIGPTQDSSKISDDYGSALRFTGGMIGVCAQDVAGTRRTADFDFFKLTAR